MTLDALVPLLYLRPHMHVWGPSVDTGANGIPRRALPALGPHSMRALPMRHVQGYIAQKKTPPPKEHHKALGIGLL